MITDLLDVSENSSTGQKLVPIPAEADIQSDDKVRLIVYGKHRPKIPGYMKMHQDLDNILHQIVRADNYIKSENRSDASKAISKLHESGKLIGEAMSELDDEFTIHPTEEEQEIIDNHE